MFSSNIAQNFCYEIERVPQLQKRRLYEVNCIINKWFVTDSLCPKKQTEQWISLGVAWVVAEPEIGCNGMCWLTVNIEHELWDIPSNLSTKKRYRTNLLVIYWKHDGRYYVIQFLQKWTEFMVTLANYETNIYIPQPWWWHLCEFRQNLCLEGLHV